MARHSDIYKDPDWERSRQYVIARANGLCERCRRKRIIKKGKIVHHKIWLADENKHNWDIAYNPENLEYLCNDCHEDEHDRSTGLQKFLVPPGS